MACATGPLPALADVGEQPDLTGALDRARQLRLVAAAGAGDARGADLALVAHRAPEPRHVLVVDGLDLVAAIRAGLATPASGRALPVSPPPVVTAAASPTLLRPLCLRPPDLERDVVVRRPGPGRRLLKVAGVRGHVALRGEPATVLRCALPGTEELDGVGDDIDRLALVPVLVLPLAPLEAAVDGHGAALLEILGAVLALGSPDGDVEVVGLVLPLAALVVLAAGVAGHAHAAHGRASGGVPELGIPSEIPGDHDHVYVACCHRSPSFSV